VDILIIYDWHCFLMDKDEAFELLCILFCIHFGPYIRFIRMAGVGLRNRGGWQPPLYRKYFSFCFLS